MGKNSSCSMRIASPKSPRSRRFRCIAWKTTREGEKVRSWVPLVLVSRLGEVGTSWTFRHSPLQSPGADVCDWLCEVFRRAAHPHHPGMICQVFHRALHRTRNRTGCYGGGVVLDEIPWGMYAISLRKLVWRTPISPMFASASVLHDLGQRPRCISKGGWTGCRRL
jgi:hypothetical protein